MDNGGILYMDLWSQLKSMYEKSDRQIKILDGIAEQGKKELCEISISPESTMGNIIINTNGIIVDNWIRILGQSSEYHAGIGKIYYSFIDDNKSAVCLTRRTENGI